MSQPGELEETPTQWKSGGGGGEEVEKTGSKAPKKKGEKKKKTKADRENPDVEPVEGYEGVSFKANAELTPPPPPAKSPEPPEMVFADMAKLTEAECKDALMQHVSEHCCYGKKPAQELEIKKTEGVTALHYTIETFNEGRSTKMKKVPYKGGSVDGPENGPAPPPWSIPTDPKKNFHTHKIKKEVPHTAKVKKCKDCKGRGWEKCDDCEGWGKVECERCDGSGKSNTTDAEGNEVEIDCIFCHGSGEAFCFDCGGDGRVTCGDCDGYGKLKCFVQLKVKFHNHDDEFILETTDMPDELVKNVGGTVLFEQISTQITPISKFPVKEINETSNKFAKKHQESWQKERRIKQRQILRGVPVTEVHYKWEDVESRYWVYGNERKVYCPDYPQTCCWGCSIL